MNKKIQVLRGLAILAVVIIHTCPHGLAGIVIRTLVNYAVALFLFCSGWLTKTSFPDVKKFYKKRLTRVLIPYAIWSFFYTDAFAYRDGTFSRLPHNYLYNLVYGTANFSLYFIIVYVILTLLTPLIGKLLQSEYKWVGFLVTPIYMIVTTYIPVLTGRVIIPVNITPFLRLQWFGFYYLGMALGNHAVEWKLTKKQTVIFYCLSLIAAFLEGLYWNHLGSYSMAGTQIKMTTHLSSCMAGVLAHVYLNDSKFSGSGKFEKYMAFIGDYSFGIYLSHVMLIGLSGRIFGDDGIPFPLNTMMILFGSLLCCIVTDVFFREKLNRLLGIK